MPRGYIDTVAIDWCTVVWISFPSLFTCSLVVRPIETSPMWKTVRPTTGMDDKPHITMTAILCQLLRRPTVVSAKEIQGSK